MNALTHTPATAPQIAQLVAQQRDFFRRSGTQTLDFRLAQLRKLRQLIVEHEAELIAAIHADFGKSKYETQLTEILPLLGEINLALKKLKKWIKPTKVKTNILNFPAKSYLVPEPLGVALVIGAWNFPYNLSLIPTVGSMAAGNTTIIKPSELPAATSRIMARLINDNFEPHYLRVVEGGIPETTALLQQRYDKIFFTGSPKVGKIVNQAAAPHLTNVTLELGGKNPAIFTKDCSLPVAVKRMIWGKFLNAGQLCITTDYALVHRDIKAEFLRLAVAEIEKSNFSPENHNLVQIINERNFDRVVGLIDPEKVHYGGRYSRAERLIYPTILTDVSTEDAIMQEEIFGPLLPVLEFDTLDEAFALIQGFEKPLSAYLFSNDAHSKERFLREVPFGNGGINEAVMQNSNPDLPFGGVGNSGMGSYHGEYSFKCFSHYKAVMEKTPVIETNLKYYGYTEQKIKLFKKLM
ncbi:MAG: aldehyde dehydrogenase family protein [Bacteroidota bacterium]